MSDQSASPPEAALKAQNIALALQHLHSAMACLDAADEVKAPPHVQMAIDMLEDRDEDAAPSAPGVFRF